MEKIINKLLLYIEKIPIAGTKMNYIDNILTKTLNYKKALNKIDRKLNNNEKINVIFLVSEYEKWNANELYTIFKNSKMFNSYIVVNQLPECHYKINNEYDLVKNLTIFKNKYENVLCSYDTEKKKPIPLEKFDADIIFYQQPWCIFRNQSPDSQFKNALTCYYQYGVSVLDSCVDVLPFHEKLFYYFLPNQLFKESILKYAHTNLENARNIGFPKLDVYNSLSIKRNTKNIIYAPHRSIQKKETINIGTFAKTGKFILEFAKQHPEYNWIFKPHPRLKYDLALSNDFDKEFADKYYNEWENIGEIYDKGDYFEKFVNSDLLITDCDSFLIEYMPTTKPIIRLEKDNSTPLSNLGKKIIEGIYRVSNFDEFNTVFTNLMEKDSDELLNIRQEIISNIIFKIKNPSEAIYHELLNTIKNKELQYKRIAI